MSEAWLSELQVNSEAMSLVALRLAGEVHEFAAARGIAQGSVEDHLPFVLGVICDHLADFILVGPVVASGASGLTCRVGFVPEVYRRIAEAAKDRLAGGHGAVSPVAVSQLTVAGAGDSAKGAGHV